MWQLVLYVNRPPSPGACDVFPRAGAAFGTTFALSCSGWSDAEADVPLTYHFTALRDTGVAYALGADSVNATIKVSCQRFRSGELECSRASTHNGLRRF
jgi:hypothetical protein